MSASVRATALTVIALIPAAIGGAIASFILGAALMACTPKPLPEIGTPAEQVYARRCGVCHRPFDPRSMTATMWQAQVKMMEGRIVAAGQPPLTSEQRQAILDYLQRNAGSG
ncbi:MAG: hypothetical protein ACREQN_18310 [Candidatus Binataceae bacterium]